MKVLFINSGIMGHKSVLHATRRALDGCGVVQSRFLALDEELNAGDRVLRRCLCWRVAASNRDLARWRMEWFTGLHARRVLARVERRHGPFDLLHLHPQPLGYALLDRMRRTPTVVSIDATQDLACDGVPPSEQWTFRPSFRQDERVFERAGWILTASEWAAAALRRRQSKVSRKITVVPWGMDVDAFPRSLSEHRWERSHQLGFSPKVLFMGGDFERKGGFALLDAWQRGGFGSHAVLRVVTSASTPPSALPEGVEWVGPLKPRTEAWLQAWASADLFAMPTQSEAFGVVFQEAAAAALPVVATEVCAVPELVMQGETGFLSRPGDVTGLVQNLDRLLRDAALRRRFGDAARERVAARSSLPVFRSHLLNAFQRLRQESGASTQAR